MNFSAVLSTRRRGAMLPLIAILLPMLLIFLGFSVDLAYMQTTRMELRAAADAAARAGATCLQDTDDPIQARQVAQQIARANEVAGAPLLLRDEDIDVGRSDTDASGRFSFVSGATPANSVRITATRQAGSLGGPVSLFFGSLIGTRSFEPVQIASASFLNVDICLVLDRSSSMKLNVNGDSGGMRTTDSRFCRVPGRNSRWIALDAAVDVFVSELRDSDAQEQVALATYSSDLSGYSPPLCGASSQPSSLDCSLNADLGQVESAMDRLATTVWNGNTNIEAGMRTGLNALLNGASARAGAEKILIVMTDGNENEGSAMDAARDCRSSDVTVHTVTFSDDASQGLMRSVASTARGVHFHANTANELREVFRELAAQTTRLTE